jgi:zinc transport system ATP-binding protein
MSTPRPLTENEPAIDIRGVSFRFDDGPLVLEDVNLTVDPLDLAIIIGPNGGGKTTLVKLLLGLLQPNTGSVRVLGRDPQRVRRQIGYMPQHAHTDPMFPISVLEVVMMGRLNSVRAFGPPNRRDRQLARQALAAVNASDLASRHFADLSGGQRQRVLLARALACEPQLLLLDEPEAGLDLRVENDFHQLLRGLSKRMTIILVSHDLGFVSKFVKTVICVNRTVDVHPTHTLNGNRINEIYGGEVRMVRHDHSELDH